MLIVFGLNVLIIMAMLCYHGYSLVVLVVLIVLVVSRRIQGGVLEVEPSYLMESVNVRISLKESSVRFLKVRHSSYRRHAYLTFTKIDDECVPSPHKLTPYIYMACVVNYI